jgi:hypothetical protein
VRLLEGVLRCCRLGLLGEDEDVEHEEDEPGDGCRHDDGQQVLAPGLHVVPCLMHAERWLGVSAVLQSLSRLGVGGAVAGADVAVRVAASQRVGVLEKPQSHAELDDGCQCIGDTKNNVHGFTPGCLADDCSFG